MNNNIIFKAKIINLAVYFPETILDNEFYVEHYKKKGISEEETLHMLHDTLGKERRHVIKENSGENSLTMAIHAAKSVLQKTNLSGSDIDVVCLCSLTAEYSVPPSSTLLSKAINGKKDSVCFDLNVNCTGMAFAYDTLVRYMSVNPAVNRILLVASDYLTYLVNPDDMIFYSSFADCALAMIIERTEENIGLLSSKFTFYPPKDDLARGPGCGFSKLLTSKPEEIRYWMQNTRGDTTEIFSIIRSMIEEANLKPEDIKLFCFSQFAERFILHTRNEFHLDEDTLPYIGNKYGYTGSTSVFLVLHEAIKHGKIKHGDYVFVFTSGYGVQEIYLLFRY